MSIDQVRTAYNYPLIAPSNSTYLKLDEKRCFITVIEWAFSQIIKFGQTSSNNSQTVFYTRESSQNMLDSIISNGRGHFFDQDVCYDNEKLNAAYTCLVSSLKQIKIEERNNASILYTAIASLATKAFSQQLVGLGINTIVSGAKLASEDFKIGKGDEVLYQKNQRTMECHDFAFYHIHEEQAFPYIFNLKSSSWPLDFALNPLEFMPKWGYQLVQDPQPGDLVIFFSTLKGFVQAKHWGILNENKRVLSKWGHHPAFEHGLEDVALAYGCYVHFFRKKHKFILQKSLEVELNSAKTAIGNFTHSATLSPLSAYGTLVYFQIFFKNAAKANVEQALPRSIFGRKVIQTYGESVLCKLYNIVIFNNHDRFGILEKIQEISNQAAKETPLDFTQVIYN